MTNHDGACIIADQAAEKETHPAAAMSDMLVIQFGDRTLKGFADSEAWSGQAGLAEGPATSIMLQTPEGVEEIALDGVKALFFVRSFAGEGHDAIRFHDHMSALECLWVRVTFHDSEVIEGLICNTAEFVLQTGFFMSPTDPEDNNWLIYIFKTQLKSFEVLGVRPSPNDLPMMKYAQTRRQPATLAR